MIMAANVGYLINISLGIDRTHPISSKVEAIFKK